eukprot:300676-Prymnesium_polylepis.1
MVCSDASMLAGITIEIVSGSEIWYRAACGMSTVMSMPLPIVWAVIATLVSADCTTDSHEPGCRPREPEMIDGKDSAVP